MSLTDDQRWVLDQVPLDEVVHDGVTAEQALNLQADAFLHWCDLEGVDRPDWESARDAILASR